MAAIDASTDLDATVRAAPVWGRRARRAAVVSIIVAGALVLAWAGVQMASAPVPRMWFVLLAFTAITGWATLRMRRVPISFSISDTFTIAATLLFGTAAGTALAVLDALVMSLRLAVDRAPAMGFRLVFNATATALAMWTSGSMFFALTRTGPLAQQPGTVRDVVGPLALFAAVYFLLNTGFVAVAVAYERNEPIVRVWKAHLSALWLAYFSGASIAAVLVLMTVGSLVDLRTLVVLLPLLVILHVTYRAALDRVAERVEHHAQLALYAEALRSTVDGVLVLDRNGVVTFVNSAGEELLRSEAIVGHPVNVVFRLVDPQSLEPSPLAHGAGSRECLLLRDAGGPILIEERHAEIRDGGGGAAAGTIVTFHDISARKAIEAEREALLASEREARERADAANRLKDEFLATISHELRTPATGILGWARLLKSGRMDSEQARQALDALERGAQAQAKILEDLLDMSRIVRGTLRIDLEPTDVGEVLAAAIETVMPAVRAKQIQFTSDIAANLPIIYADPDRLRQVFWNVLANAVKFTQADGTIEVTARAGEDRLTIEVVDSGHGIDPGALPYIFDRFRQADGSMTRPHGGLGLGLAIVQHLVELHGGTVTAHSEGRGQGARFRIELPVAHPPRSASAPAGAPVR